MIHRTDRALRPEANEQFAVSLVRRPDDGLDGPALPVFPAPHHAPRASVHRDDHQCRVDARRPPASPRFRSGRTSACAATRRQRPAGARARREAGRAVGLRRDQSQLRLSVGARAEGELRRVPDGRTGARCRLRGRDARCGRPPGDGQASDRPRRRARLRFRPRFCRYGGGGGVRGVHRPCAQRRAERVVAEGEPRSAAAQLRLRPSTQARFSGADDRRQRRHRAVGRTRGAACIRRRRDARARRIPRSVLSRRGRPPPLRRCHADAFAGRRAARSRSLCRGTTRPRRAASRDRAPRARSVPRAPRGRRFRRILSDRRSSTTRVPSFFSRRSRRSRRKP